MVHGIFAIDVTSARVSQLVIDVLKTRARHRSSMFANNLLNIDYLIHDYSDPIDAGCAPMVKCIQYIVYNIKVNHKQRECTLRKSAIRQSKQETEL